MVETAVTRAGIAVAVALVASLVLVIVERGVRPSERTLTWTRRVGIAATIAIVLGAAGVAAARQQHIRSGLSDRWHTFSSFADVVNTNTGARIGQVIPDKRYDYWKVAVKEFRNAPIVGSGAGASRSATRPTSGIQAHALRAQHVAARAVGDRRDRPAAAAGDAAHRARRARPRARARAPAAHPAIAAVATLSAAFFLQRTLDWLEEVPALLAPAVGLPLAVLRATSRASAACRGRSRRRSRSSRSS